MKEIRGKRQWRTINFTLLMVLSVNENELLYELTLECVDPVNPVLLYDCSFYWFSSSLYLSSSLISFCLSTSWYLYVVFLFHDVSLKK